MANIKLVLWKNRPIVKDGETLYPIYLRFSQNNKTHYIATQYYCHTDDWDSENGDLLISKNQAPHIIMYQKHKIDIGELKNAIDEIYYSSYEIIHRHRGNLSFSTFKREYYNSRTPSATFFVNFAKDYKDDLIKDNRKKSAIVLKETLNRLRAYDSNLDQRMIGEIDEDFVLGFIKFSKENGNSNNTIRIRLAQIQRLLRIAITKGYYSESDYPFSTIKGDGKISVASFVETNMVRNYKSTFNALQYQR